MVVWVSAVHSRNRVAAWEPWLTAAAQHQERGSEYLLLTEDQHSKHSIWLLLSV